MLALLSTMNFKLILAVLCSLCLVESKLYPIEWRIPLLTAEAVPGVPWPRPQKIHMTSQQLTLDPASFRFVSEHEHSCKILGNAFKRYHDLIFIDRSYKLNKALPHLQTVVVHIENTPLDCGYPQADMDETYWMNIPTNQTDKHHGVLRAKTLWGALRGLETFSQMIQVDAHKQLALNETIVHDFPQYSYRGLMVDTARHYIPMVTLLANLDAMAYNKLNTFHWHIVDDQSFPYESIKYPNISKFGSYSPRHVYTQQDVATVIEYARMRGIRVVPEIDTPGHTHAMSWAMPSLLTPCYGQKGRAHTPSYPHFSESEILNPMREETFSFMKDMFQELHSVFKDHYIHLGMDEVSYACWQSSPEIANFMTQKGMKAVHEVEEFYVRNTIANVKDVGYKYMMWQDPVDNGVTLANDSIVMVWKDKNLDPEMDLWQNYIVNVAKKNYKIILSACWYLNYINYPYPGYDWEKYYLCDPRDFNGTEDEKNLVIGGQANIWAEFVDASNLLSRLWPRASAVAEKLWSRAEDTKNAEDARKRLDVHRCLMVRRGIPAAPILGGYCGDYEWEMNKKVNIVNMGDRVKLND